MPGRPLKVIVKSPFSEYSGYGRDGFGLIRALHRWGCDVYPQPTWLDVPIPRDLLPLFAKSLYGPFDLLINHWDPDHLKITREARATARVAVAWSMWEFTHAPDNPDGSRPLRPCRDHRGEDGKSPGSPLCPRCRPAPRSGLYPHAKSKSSFRDRLRWFDLVLGYDDVSLGSFEPFIPAKVHSGVLQGGYDSALWRPMDRDWDGDRFQFFMHGALNHRKCPWTAIEAWHKLKAEKGDAFAPARLALHTNTPGVLFPELNKPFAHAGIRVFVSSLDRQGVLDLYQASHCLLSPSRGEGKNLPALEFMSTGGAAAVTNFGGHALSLDTSLPTPAGWTTMGAVGVGSVILDEQSRPTVVTAKSAIHYRDCYRVTFSDGTGVIASDEHRWQVQQHQGEPWKVKTTRELHELQGIRQNWRLPEPQPFEGIEQELLVPPYVLGLWLADGEQSGARITMGTADVAEQVKQLSRYGEVISETYTRSNQGEGWRLTLRSLKPQLNELGVLNRKHIPGKYLRASRAQRLELLRGLMDGDGCVTSRGQCNFDNTSQVLIAGVQELLRSLGIKVTTSRIPRKAPSRESRRLSFYAEEEVFTLERKVLRQREFGRAHARVKTRTIRSIEPTLTVPTQCLTVDSGSHLYLCGEGWIPTHNTQWLGGDWAYPLDYRLGATFGDCPWGAHDAKVSSDHLADVIWHIYTHRSEAKLKAQKAAELIPKMCDWQVVVENLFRRIRDTVTSNGVGPQVYDVAMACRRDQDPAGPVLVR